MDAQQIIIKIMDFHEEIIKESEARLAKLQAEGKGLSYPECRDLAIVIMDAKKAIENARWI